MSCCPVREQVRLNERQLSLILTLFPFRVLTLIRLMTRRAVFCQVYQGQCWCIGDRIGLLEDYRHMCMSDETEAAGKILKASFRQHLGGQIFPQRAVWAAMHQ